MAKEQFQQELEAMLQKGSGDMSLAQVLNGLVELLIRHQDTFAGVTYRYRLSATDSATSRAFALEDGRYAPLDETAPVDVTILGKEQHLLAVFHKKLNPAGALLTGKIKVKGSGCIRTREHFLQLIDMGVGRIGSTASIVIVEAFKEKFGA